MALGAVVLLGATIVTGCSKKSSFTYSEAEAAKQDIVASVTATGTIEPVTSVDVGTQVSGVISKLYVDYNSVVKAGDVIAELDRTNLTSELNSAQASLKSALSNLNYQKTNYGRYKNLYDKGLISAGTPFLCAGATAGTAAARECEKGADQPGLCHHHKPH